VDKGGGLRCYVLGTKSEGLCSETEQMRSSSRVTIHSNASDHGISTLGLGESLIRKIGGNEEK